MENFHEVVMVGVFMYDLYNLYLNNIIYNIICTQTKKKNQPCLQRTKNSNLNN